MKINWDHIEFGQDHFWWIYWWNPLKKDIRYIGYYQDWHDGPFSHFGLWFTNISWRLPLTRHSGKRSFGYSRYVNAYRKRKSVDN